MMGITSNTILALVLFSATAATADPIYSQWQISMPRVRFQEWNDLSSEERELASTAGYNRNNWETVAYDEFNEIEYLNFGEEGVKEDLEKYTALVQLGFTETNWDCWINHFSNYGWSDLEEADVASAWEALGWDANSWEGGDESDFPASYNKGWDELNDEEKQGAANLCYLPETWDGEASWSNFIENSEYINSREEWIREYTADDLLYSQWEQPMPRFRYVRWENYDEKIWAESVGYTKALWENLFTNNIEALAFEDLDNDEYTAGLIGVESDENESPKTNVMEMGFDEDSWDCWINHYSGYAWSDLVEFEIAEAYVALGYDQEKWDAGDVTAAFEKNWFDLTDDEKQAAANLCFIPETWDGQAFEYFVETSAYIQSDEPFGQPVEGGPPVFCFPGTSTVTVQDVGPVSMSNLQLGDKVLVDENGMYEEVYTFGHKKVDAKAIFTKITTSDGSSIKLSQDHMIKMASSSSTVPAKLVRSGDRLMSSTSGEVVVKSIKTIKENSGMYAPFTKSGYIVVDNVIASNYISMEGTEHVSGTSFTHQWVAHAMNAPHRMYCNYFACEKETYDVESGISSWVAVPHAIAQYIVSSNNAIVMALGLTAAVVIASIFNAMELLFASPITIVGILAAMTMIRRQISQKTV